MATKLVFNPLTGNFDLVQDVSGFVLKSGDTMTGALTLANIANALTLPNATLGSIFFAGTGGVVSQDNANLFWDSTNKRLGIGATSSITNIVKVVGSVTPNAFTQANPDGSFNIVSTINFSNTLAGMAALKFSMIATGAGLLPFPSGQIASVTQSTTGAWGANLNADSPAVYKGKWLSTAGASNMGNFISVFQATKPAFVGAATPRTADGVYNGFEAQTADGTVVGSTWASSYGFYTFGQKGTVEGAGIFIDGVSATNSHYGIVLHGNSATTGIVFGTARSAIMFYDGTNFIINPRRAGTGVVSILGGVSLLDYDITLGTTTGTKIGTATTQKLGFWNATPIVQPSAFTQTYSTATKTHAALTSATLTDSTGGTADTTVAAITAVGGAGATTQQETDINNNFADVIAQINALRTDLENTKQVLNAVIDDGQAEGLLA